MLPLDLTSVHPGSQCIYIIVEIDVILLHLPVLYGINKGRLLRMCFCLDLQQVLQIPDLRILIIWVFLITHDDSSPD